MKKIKKNFLVSLNILFSNLVRLQAEAKLIFSFVSAFFDLEIFDKLMEVFPMSGKRKEEKKKKRI